MNIYEEEEFYRLKYLKYKTKYLQIKNKVENVIGGYPVTKHPPRGSSEKNRLTASKCGIYIYLLNTYSYSKFDRNKFEHCLNLAIKDNNSGYEVDKHICNIINYFDQTENKNKNYNGLECAFMKINDKSKSSGVYKISSQYKEYDSINVINPNIKDVPEVNYESKGMLEEFDTEGINVDNNGILTGIKAPDMLFKLHGTRYISSSFSFHYDYYFIKQFSCYSEKKENNNIKLINYYYKCIENEKKTEKIREQQKKREENEIAFQSIKIQGN
jgi:hypothetical protein